MRGMKKDKKSRDGKELMCVWDLAIDDVENAHTHTCAAKYSTGLRLADIHRM